MSRVSAAITIIVAAGALGGCRHHAEEPLPSVPPRAASPNVSEPWTTYNRASEMVGKDKIRQLLRTNYTRGMREQLLARTASATKLVLNAPGDSPFPYEAIPPDAVRPHRLQWRAISRSIVWQINAAIGKGQNREAAMLFAQGTRFAYDLAGGDAADATMGYAVAAELRQAFRPALPLLNRNDLIALSRSLQRAVRHRTPISTLAQNEKQAAYEGVRWMMAKQLDREAMIEEYGPDGRDLHDYLRTEPEKRAAFYRGLLDEIEQEAKIAQEMAARVPSTRPPYDDWMKSLPLKRTWRKAARQIGRGVRPIIPIAELDLTRLRLLMLEIEIRRRVLETGRPLPSLRDFSETARTDPYTGADFHYRTDGREFLIWSAGPDGRDDQGRTDDKGLTPDTVLGETIRR